MPQPPNRPLNIVCLATYFKGADFIRECKANGCHVVLITKEKMLGEDWPRESLDDLIAVPNDAGPALFIDLLAFLARDRFIDRVIALEEFDVTLTYCYTPEDSGVMPRHTSPPRDPEEFAEFCAAMTRRYAT